MYSTLLQVETAKRGNPAVRALSYYFVLFPSVDVLSAYPLVVHIMANNIYTALFCRDTSRKSKTPKLDFLLQLVIKFISAILPIAAALFISNLVYVLKHAGLTGFFISFFFPTALQLSSTWKCSKLFPPHTNEREGEGEGEGEGEKQPSLKMHNVLQNSSPMGSTEKCSTSALIRMRLSHMFASYRTPFSNRVLSHPITVSLIGGVGVVLFLLTLGSLAVHPKQLHCTSEL